MHAIEYFSCVLVVEPLPTKEAKNTAYAFKHAVLERFGASAQVLTDNGTEYEGEFHALLAECFIDHRRTSPNHPQSNGLVERSVQTIKQALRSHCEDTRSVDTWDEKLPYISLAYNCSKHASTKCSPYTLLYAREPMFPASALQGHMNQPLPPLDTPRTRAEAADVILTRAQYLEHVMPTVANNLAIAHHRDSLRYARIRSGNYAPKLHKFAPGDYVYVRRPNILGTLQVEAKQLIVRIAEVRDSGVVVLQGRCGTLMSNHVCNIAPCHLPFLDGTLHPELAVPPTTKACVRCHKPDREEVMLLCDLCGDGWHTFCLDPPLTRVPKGTWMCPQCQASGLLAPPPADSRRLGPAPSDEQVVDRLFVGPAARARDRAAQLLEGCHVSKEVRVRGRGARAVVQTVWGTVHFRGIVCRPQYFLVKYSDGTEEVLTDTALRKRHPLPSNGARHTGLP
jgi:hypothetical protein